MHLGYPKPASWTCHARLAVSCFTLQGHIFATSLATNLRVSVELFQLR
jgi:hypothetical protein